MTVGSARHVESFSSELLNGVQAQCQFREVKEPSWSFRNLSFRVRESEVHLICQPEWGTLMYSVHVNTAASRGEEILLDQTLLGT